MSPEATRKATLMERHTVERLGWSRLVRLHRWLELSGKITSVLWAGFMATVLLGVEWRDLVESAVNSGRPVRGAIVVVLVVPTLLFVAAHSSIGFARWRLQRELWRRDVQRLSAEGYESEA